MPRTALEARAKMDVKPVTEKELRSCHVRGALGVCLELQLPIETVTMVCAALKITQEELQEVINGKKA